MKTIRRLLIYSLIGSVGLLGFEIITNPRVESFETLTRLGQFATVIFIITILFVLLVMFVDLILWLLQ